MGRALNAVRAGPCGGAATAEPIKVRRPGARPPHHLDCAATVAAYAAFWKPLSPGRWEVTLQGFRLSSLPAVDARPTGRGTPLGGGLL